MNAHGVHKVFVCGTTAHRNGVALQWCAAEEEKKKKNQCFWKS
jgi:hypothetical protein